MRLLKPHFKDINPENVKELADQIESLIAKGSINAGSYALGYCKSFVEGGGDLNEIPPNDFIQYLIDVLMLPQPKDGRFEKRKNGNKMKVVKH